MKEDTCIGTATVAHGTYRLMRRRTTNLDRALWPCRSILYDAFATQAICPLAFGFARNVWRTFARAALLLQVPPYARLHPKAAPFEPSISCASTEAFLAR